MKTKALVLALVVFFPVLLSGCGSDQNGSQQAPVANSAVDAQNARATLTVSPDKVSSCEKGAHINPTVTWQRIDTSIKSTKVTVSSLGSSDEKLFSEGGFQGSAKAGDWVVPGVIFRLYDKDSGALLASHTVGTTPCAGD